MSHSPEYYVLRDRRYRDLSQPANERFLQDILGGLRILGPFGLDREKVKLLKNWVRAGRPVRIEQEGGDEWGKPERFLSRCRKKEPEPFGGIQAGPGTATSFLRGDVNQDGQVSIQDASTLLQFIYNKDHEPACLKSADVNNDGMVRLEDALQLIIYSTQGLSPPAMPFPAPGRVPLDPGKAGHGSTLGCLSYESGAAKNEEVEVKPSG